MLKNISSNQSRDPWERIATVTVMVSTALRHCLSPHSSFPVKTGWKHTQASLESCNWNSLFEIIRYWNIEVKIHWQNVLIFITLILAYPDINVMMDFRFKFTGKFTGSNSLGSPTGNLKPTGQRPETWLAGYNLKLNPLQSRHGNTPEPSLPIMM